jgi:trans-2,3-dihydro-3-hydroxyanthranilate isomerase
VSGAHYLLFDVFTDVAFAGNPLAVFPDAAIDGKTMQSIARELNLSESVFLRRGEDGVAATLRIFTPQRELVFAGHPTIGTAIALVDQLRWIPPGAQRFSVREGVGDIAIAVERAERTMAWLTTPPVHLGSKVARSEAAALLGLTETDVSGDLPPQVAGAGTPLLFVPLCNPETVDGAAPDATAIRAFSDSLDCNGVFIFSQTAEGAYARMFAPQLGVFEDPATGGATGPLYAYLAHHRTLPRRSRFVNEQGTRMGRRSMLHVRLEWDGEVPHRIEVGGNAVFVGEGRLFV